MPKEYPTQPVVGVGAVLVHNGKILLIKRGTEPGRGKWSIPGGVVELGEKVVDTVVREVKEECNLEVEVDRLIDVVDDCTRDEKGRLKYHFVILDFLVRLKGGTLKSNSELLDAQWVSLDEVEKYDLTKTFRAFFERNKENLKEIQL
ncbi:MAG: NUDIX hydrolase [Candidatus Bathyarchaeia archaeon]